MTAPAIRELSFEDYPQVAALKSRYGLRTKPTDEWAHLWLGNPVYRCIPGWCPGWVLECEGRIVGYIGNIPLLYEFEGAALRVAAGRAWAVDPAFRSYSLLLMDNYFGQPGVDLFLNTTVNSHAIEAFSVFESARVPVGEWDRSSFWVTDYPGFARSVLSMKCIPMAGVLSYPVAACLYLRDLTRGGSTRAARMEVEDCPSFDERFDVFWQALRRENPHLLLGLRSREVLQWHFHFALLREEAWIATVPGPAGLLAYGVFMRQDVPEIGLKRVRMVDFQALEGGSHLLSPILAWAHRRCRKERVHALEVVGTGRHGPYQRKLPTWCYFYKTTNESLAHRLRDPKSWNPSSFDGDASL